MSFIILWGVCIKELKALYKKSYSPHDWDHVIEALKIIVKLHPNASLALGFAALISLIFFFK